MPKLRQRETGLARSLSQVLLSDRVAAHRPGPILKVFRSWHNATWQPSQPGFPESPGRPGNPGEEGMRLFPDLLKGILLFQPFGPEARILLQGCDCGPVSDMRKRSLWSSKGCVEALPTASTPPASHPNVCVCVCPAPSTDRVPCPHDRH